MEKLVFYKVKGNGEFVSQVFNNRGEAERVAFISKGIVIEFTK